MSIEEILKLLGSYGLPGTVVVFLIVILLRSKFVVIYPRPTNGEEGLLKDLALQERSGRSSFLDSGQGSRDREIRGSSQTRAKRE
jgi:hypothetical protein